MLKDELLSRHSLEELFEIYITNDQTSWQPKVYTVIEEILFERKIPIPKQLSPGFSASKFVTFSWSDVRSSVFASIYTSNDQVAKLGLGSIKFYFALRRIGLFLLFVFSINILSALTRAFIRPELDLVGIGVGIFLLIVPVTMILYPLRFIDHLSIEQAIPFIFDPKVARDRLFPRLAKRLISSLESRLNTAKYAYVYAYVTFLFIVTYGFSFLDLGRGILVLEKNRHFLEDNDVLCWVLGWLFFINRDFDKASIEFRKNAQRNPDVDISELIMYCELKQNFKVQNSNI